MKVIKNADGRYFVLTKGFVGASATEATQIESADVANTVKSLNNVGFQNLTVEDAPVDTKDGGSVVQNADGTSFAVRFIRPKDVRADGSIAPRKRKYSPRRFKEEWEAGHHAARFIKIEGHKGAVIERVKEPVNAWVNKFTGKTNPEIGKKRTNR